MSNGWLHTAADTAADRTRIEFSTDRPHPARVYDWLLGGKDNFAADRAAAQAGLDANPAAAITARTNREFLRRAVEFLAREPGIRQFLDVGTGLPTSPNVHETAQSIAPDTRVVYVDNDPLVLAHARALLTSPPGHGPTSYLDADLRDPTQILTGAARLLDLTQPVGLLLVAVTHHLTDDDDPHQIVAQLLDALPAGSYLALSHITADLQPAWYQIEADFAARGGVLRPRSRDQIAAFFSGLDLVDPGLVPVHRWRPDTQDRHADRPDTEVSAYGGLARKPPMPTPVTTPSRGPAMQHG